MPIERPSLNHPQDHLMANTWRLIFEQRSQLDSATPVESVSTFSVLEQVLPEYRLIGYTLASQKNLRYLD